MSSHDDFSALRNTFSSEDFSAFLKKQTAAEERWKRFFTEESVQIPESEILKDTIHNAAFLACFRPPEEVSEEEKKQFSKTGELFARQGFAFSPELAYATLHLSDKKSLTPLIVDKIERSQRSFQKHPALSRQLLATLTLHDTLGSLEILDLSTKMERYPQNREKESVSQFRPPPASHLPKMPNIAAKNTKPQSSENSFEQEVEQSGTDRAVVKYFEEMGRQLAQKTKTEGDSLTLAQQAKQNAKGKIGIGTRSVAGTLGAITTASLLFGGSPDATASALDFLTNL